MKGRYLVGFTTIPHAVKLTMPQEDAAKMDFAYLRPTTLEIGSADAIVEIYTIFYANLCKKR